MSTRVSTQFGPSSLSLETGSLARQADGAVVVQQGGTVVLVTAVGSGKPSEKFDMVPLTCDYREKTYAAGKIPGGFFKREGRPTEKEILTARLIDRPIRPLFPKGFLHELQVMAAVLSSDGEYDPDVLGVLGASCALRLSSLPFPDSLGAVRVGYVDQQFVANPTYQQLTRSPIDLVLAGTSHGIMTIEAGLKEVPEDQLVQAIAFGAQQLKTLIAMQNELVAKAGKPKSDAFQVRKPSAELLDAVRSRVRPELERINEPKKKAQRHEEMAKLAATLVEELVVEGTVTAQDVAVAFEVIDRYRSKRIFPKQLAAVASHSVMLFRPSMAAELERAGCLSGARLIYSLWEGYLKEDRLNRFRMWRDRLRIPLTHIHTSGHASVADLKRLAQAIHPKRVVPIHSAQPGRYAELFERVDLKHDGKWWEV